MRAFHPPIAAGADRPVADPGGDPLWRGQGSEQQRSRSMAGVVPAIPLLLVMRVKGVEGRAKPGHDGKPAGVRRVTISGRWYNMGLRF